MLQFRPFGVLCQGYSNIRIRASMNVKAAYQRRGIQSGGNQQQIFGLLAAE